MAVSKVGLGWPVGERQFDTLAAWLSALGAGAQEAHCKGDIGTGNVIVNAQPTGAILIRGDVQYAGNNHTALATLTGRLELLTSAHFLEVRDIRVISSGANGGIRCLNTNKALRCYVQHAGDAGFTNGIITGLDIESCVTRNTDGLSQFGIRCFTAGGSIRNSVSFGARRAFSGNGAGITVTNCFGLQSVLQDYQIINGATRTNSASQDTTGNITGYTSAEFVNFAAGDYRIKSSSMLFPLNVGAFFESGAGSFELTPETGNFSYTGGDLALTVNRALSLAGGAYSYTGGNVDLLLNRSLTLDAGSLSYTGQDLALTANRVITPQSGAFSYTGGAVDLQYNQDTDITLNIEGGVFSFSGGEIALTVNRLLGVVSGEFNYSGNDIDFSTDKFLAIESGEFNYSGDDLPLSVSRAFSIDSGAFSYAGGSIIITYSGQVIRRITNYSVNYEQDDLVIAYAADELLMAYENDFVAMQYEGITSGSI